MAGSGHRRRGAVIVLGAGAGGYVYALRNVNAGVQSASSWNKASAKTLKESVEDAQMLLDGTSEAQVADPQVLEELKNAVDKAKAMKGARVAPNGLLVWELLDAESAYDESTNGILVLDVSLDKAMKAVEASVADKLSRTRRMRSPGRLTPPAASPRSSNYAGRSADAATTSSQPSGSAIPTPGSKRSTTRSRSPSAWPTASATRTTSSP